MFELDRNLLIRNASAAEETRILASIAGYLLASVLCEIIKNILVTNLLQFSYIIHFQVKMILSSSRKASCISYSYP